MSHYDLHCPYCETDIDDPDDCYAPETTYEHQCPACEKHFVFTVDYIRDYSAAKAECLNGAPHDYKETTTFPRQYTRLRCSMCDDHKPISDARRAELKAQDEAQCAALTKPNHPSEPTEG